MVQDDDDEEDKSSVCKVYHWKDADIVGMSHFLATYDWNYLFSVNPTVDEMWTAFSNVMHFAIDTYVPAINGSVNPRAHKRHYPKSIRKALARKRCLWQKYRADHDNSVLLQRYQSATKHCREVLREYEIMKQRQVIDRNNVGGFYKFVNSRLSVRSGVGVLRSDDGSVASTDMDKANNAE